jgi:alkanesulfonate monooxygenase SsuD/methylene tetrahydromethanopterin reductase-like flavin-dependent oxidoreductase (luciferase family)
MRVGTVLLPTYRWPDARALWQRAEAMGFETTWTYDHLTWRNLRDGPWFGAVPVLAAAAAVTSTMRIGTLVASPNYRHPVTFAKELMSIDDIAGGRLRVGLGAGGTGFDAEALGAEPVSRAVRTSRFEEFVEHLDVLLGQSATAALDGEFYAAREARAVPGCVSQPRAPFAIAATGPRGMRLAARHAETWVTFGDATRSGELSPRECLEVAARQVADLDEACAAEGRDPASVGRLFLEGQTREPWLASVEAYRDLAGSYAQLGFTEIALHWPRTEPPYVARMDVFEAIAAESPPESGSKRG